MRNNLSHYMMHKKLGTNNLKQFLHLVSFFNADLKDAFISGHYDEIYIKGICKATFVKGRGLGYLPYLIKRVIYGDPKDRKPFENLKKQLERHGHHCTFN